MKDANDLRRALALGREQRHAEFKGPGIRTDKAFLAKVVRAILGMANLPDGGTVVIGVEDSGTGLRPIGLDQQQVESWGFDDLQSSVSNYADPYVELEVRVINLDGADLVAIEVQGFTDIPVICKKEFTGTLRDGGLYVRRRGKIETVEVPSHVEMREVIQRAAENVARSMLRTFTRISPTGSGLTEPTDLERFVNEAGDLLG